MNIEAFLQLHANYFNQHQLVFEPLIEPWSVQFNMNQYSKFTAQNITVKSDQILNANFSYGMAVTTRKMLDRLEESLLSATVGDEGETQPAFARHSTNVMTQSMIQRKNTISVK